MRRLELQGDFISFLLPVGGFGLVLAGIFLGAWVLVTVMGAFWHGAADANGVMGDCVVEANICLFLLGFLVVGILVFYCASWLGSKAPIPVYLLILLPFVVIEAICLEVLRSRISRACAEDWQTNFPDLFLYFWITYYAALVIVVLIPIVLLWYIVSLMYNNSSVIGVTQYEPV